MRPDAHRDSNQTHQIVYRTNAYLSQDWLIDLPSDELWHNSPVVLIIEVMLTLVRSPSVTDSILRGDPILLFT
jgi:hypothetical protein